MRLSNAIAIANEAWTTIAVKFSFDNGERRMEGLSEYYFKCTKDLATLLQPGDWVVVEAAHKGQYKVVEVTAVHPESEIDPDANFDYKWAFSRVTKERLDDVKYYEQKKIDELNEQRRKHLREQIKGKLEQVALSSPESLAIDHSESDANVEPVNKHKVRI